MRAFRFLAALSVLLLAACGDTIRSPDFTSQLLGLSLGPSSATVPAGTQRQLTLVGTYSLQPESEPPTEARPIAEASYTVTPASVASVDAAGLLTALQQGTATVTATVDGVTSNTITVTVGAPVLTSIVVRTRAPDGSVGATGNASVPAGAQQSFKALGIYTDSPDPQELATDVAVSWQSIDTDVATLSPTTGVITNATAIDQGTSEIRATATRGTDSFVASGVLTVTTSQLVDLLRLEPTPASVAAGQSWQFRAIGSFANNSEGVVANDQLDWTSADSDIATVDATGLATGVALGNVQITATLKDAVVATGTVRSASANLSVGDAACTDPLLASGGATVAASSTGLCVGCIVDDEANVIDADLTNFAVVYAPVALLAATTSVTVTAADGVSFDASVGTPRTTGFIIGRPAGQLLSAELLQSNQLSVTTLLDGEIQETISNPNFLRLTLLGLLGSSDTALLSIDATKPYDALRFTFASGVLSALTNTRVFSACATATPPDVAP